MPVYCDDDCADKGAQYKENEGRDGEDLQQPLKREFTPAMRLDRQIMDARRGKDLCKEGPSWAYLRLDICLATVRGSRFTSEVWYWGCRGQRVVCRTWICGRWEGIIILGSPRRAQARM